MGKRQRRRLREQRLAEMSPSRNPYMPSGDNPFGQEQNPYTVTEDMSGQGPNAVDSEGPRAVPNPAETTRPRGGESEPAMEPAMSSLDRMKVAVVCEDCGQKGALPFGKVSSALRCRCGSSRVELLEASRKKAADGDGWVAEDYGDLVKYIPLANDQQIELNTTDEYPFKWYLWVHSPSGSEMLQQGRADDVESAKRDAEDAAEFWGITMSSSRKRAEKECTCWEGYERVPGTETCESGSCRKKQSRRRASVEGWTGFVSQDWTPIGIDHAKHIVRDGKEIGLRVSPDGKWTVDAGNAGDPSSYELWYSGESDSMELAKEDAEAAATRVASRRRANTTMVDAPQCPTCGGTGNDPQYGEKCRTCGGTGLTASLRASIVSDIVADNPHLSRREVRRLARKVARQIAR